jgi:hypothetical protein
MKNKMIQLFVLLNIDFLSKNDDAFIHCIESFKRLRML